MEAIEEQINQYLKEKGFSKSKPQSSNKVLYGLCFRILKKNSGTKLLELLEKILPDKLGVSKSEVAKTIGQVMAMKDQPKMLMIESVLKKKYDFRYDVITDQFEYKPVNSIVWELMTDRHLGSIWRMLASIKLTVSIQELRTLLNSDFTKEWNPLKHYCLSLPAWDGTDYVSQLSATIKTNNPHWSNLFMKFMVGVIASIMDASYVNELVIVLSGKQGLGKTRWLKSFVPPETRDYVHSGTMNTKSKDHSIRLAENFLIIIEEATALLNSKSEDFKEFVSRPFIKERRPYDRYEFTKPRLASIMCTTNTAQILQDITGSRRFIVIECEEINYEHNVDIVGVFSQLVFLYDSGQESWLNQSEIEELQRENDKFRSASLEEELVSKWFKPCSEDDPLVEYWMTSEMLSKIAELQKLNSTQLSVRKLGMALKALNYKQIKWQGRYRYCVTPVESFQAEESKIETAETLEVTFPNGD